MSHISGSVTEGWRVMSKERLLGQGQRRGGCVEEEEQKQREGREEGGRRRRRVGRGVGEHFPDIHHEISIGRWVWESGGREGKDREEGEWQLRRKEK